MNLVHWKVFLFLLLALVNSLVQGQAPPPFPRPLPRPTTSPSPTPLPIKLLLLETDFELRDLYLGIVVGNASRLSSEMWTLTHAYESKEEVEIVLNFFIEFFKDVESNDAQRVAKLGGAKGFKDKFATFLDSKDEAAKAFAVFILGATGDKSYAPRIGKLVNERDASFNDRWSAGNPVFYRGRAAIALGMLKAKEYTADIAKLLKSKNESDRSGAIMALAELGATEYTGKIVEILVNKEYAFDDDDSPLYFLIETKQAEKYKPQIVKAMLGESRMKIPQSAAYALASIDAKEHAKDIAKLIKNEFRRGAAMKALALLGAKEYAPQIATFLNDKSSLVVADAATALGILGAEKFAARIAVMMTKHKKDGVSTAAAEAIFLLRAKKYYANAKEAVAFKAETRPFPMSGEFHYFVQDQIGVVRQRIEKELDASRK